MYDDTGQKIKLYARVCTKLALGVLQSATIRGYLSTDREDARVRPIVVLMAKPMICLRVLGIYSLDSHTQPCNF